VAEATAVTRAVAVERWWRKLIKVGFARNQAEAEMLQAC